MTSANTSESTAFEGIIAKLRAETPEHALPPDSALVEMASWLTSQSPHPHTDPLHFSKNTSINEIIERRLSSVSASFDDPKVLAQTEADLGAIRLLLEGVGRSKETDQIHIRLKRPQYPTISEGIVSAIPLVTAISATIRRSFTQSTVLTDEAKLGRALLMLATRSGAVWSRALACMAHGMGGPMLAAGHFYYFLNNVADTSNDGVVLRRHFVEPMTAFTIARDRDGICNALKGDWATQSRFNALAIRSIKAFMSTLEEDTLAHVNSLSTLLSAISEYLALDTKVFLVDYARGVTESTSIDEDRFLRLLRLQPRPLNQLPICRALPHRQINDHEIDSPSDDRSYEYSLEVRTALAAALKGLNQDTFCKAKEIISAVADQLEQQGQKGTLLWTLLDWLAWSCTKRKGEQLAALSTIRIHRLGLARLVLKVMGDRAPEILEPADFEGILTTVFDSTNSSARITSICRAVSSLTRYLIATGRITKQDAIEIPGRNGARYVDANFFTLDEIDLFVQGLTPGYLNNLEHLYSHARATLLLGLIGLRWSEAEGLSMQEVLVGDISVIQLRAVLRRLKSRHSKRTTPLTLLLDAYLTDVLAIYDQARASQAGENDRLLSSVSAWSLRKALFKTLKNVTGDKGATFHHLRHTALNHALIALCGDKLNAPGILADFPWIKPLLDRKYIYQTHLLPAAESKRASLWAVAGLAGHASPSTTCGSYLHILDLLLYAELSPIGKRGFKADFVRASGIPDDTAKHTADIWELIWKAEKRFPNFFLRQDKRLSEPQKRPPIEGQEGDEVARAVRITEGLRLQSITIDTLDRLAAELGVSLSEAQSCLLASRTLGSIPAGRRGCGQTRHKLNQYLFNDGEPLYWPSLPIGDDAKQFARELLWALHRFKKKNTRRFDKLMNTWAHCATRNGGHLISTTFTSAEELQGILMKVIALTTTFTNLKADMQKLNSGNFRIRFESDNVDENCSRQAITWAFAVGYIQFRRDLKS